jgi:hypothetical protein
MSHVALFVAALLNDLFGVQVRGGCMCAGPIVQAEMGISSAAADALENMMLQVPPPAFYVLLFDAIFKGYELLRPGVVRLCLHYCSR